MDFEGYYLFHNIWTPTYLDRHMLLSRCILEKWHGRRRRFVDCSEIEEGERLMLECSLPLLECLEFNEELVKTYTTLNSNLFF